MMTIHQSNIQFFMNLHLKCIVLSILIVQHNVTINQLQIVQTMCNTCSTNDVTPAADTVLLVAEISINVDYHYPTKYNQSNLLILCTTPLQYSVDANKTYVNDFKNKKEIVGSYVTTPMSNLIFYSIMMLESLHLSVKYLSSYADVIEPNCCR